MFIIYSIIYKRKLPRVKSANDCVFLCKAKPSVRSSSVVQRLILLFVGSIGNVTSSSCFSILHLRVAALSFPPQFELADFLAHAGHPEDDYKKSFISSYI